jgi:hypothetical protein
MSRWAETFAALTDAPDSQDTTRHSNGLPHRVSHSVKSVTAPATSSGPAIPWRTVGALATWSETEEGRAAVVAEERRALVRWINDHFASSPIGQCVYCGHGARPDDPFVMLFAGEDRADVHASCWRAWQAAQEDRALDALTSCLDNQKTRS